MNLENEALKNARAETASSQKIIEALLSSTQAGSDVHSHTADNLQRKILYINISILTFIISLSAVQAKDSLTTMAVSAIVVANAKMQIINKKDQINITQEDINKGFIEIPSGISFSIKTNSQQGFSMDFIPVGSVFDSVKISGISNLPELTANGGSVVQRGLFSKDIVYDLNFKFKLSQNITPGKYPWPVQIAVHAIS
jgi:hypothetical protein